MISAPVHALSSFLWPEMLQLPCAARESPARIAVTLARNAATTRLAMALHCSPVSWTYYLFWLIAPTALALFSAHPEVLVIFVIALVARRWLPDPVLVLRQMRRVRSLQQQIELNPANATARVQLAELWLSRRPRRAIPMLEQALARDPESAELHYLLGVAHLRAGQAERALEPLAVAIAKDPKVRYGSAHLANGDALMRLGRPAEAITAYERYIRIHSSSLEGYCKLARARERNKDLDGAKRATAEALDTFRVLPRYQRRRQLRWWLAARLGV
jgi:tetratricopeptide (TPR) repeat protein